MSAKMLSRIKALQNLPGNSECTDCYANDVSWAVMNHGFFVCVHCAGVHRGLGVQYSQVRSTELDVGCWDEKMLEEFRQKGNVAARKRFESGVPSFYITPQVCPTDIVRCHWIQMKYYDMKFTPEKNPKTVYQMPERALVGWLNKRNEKGKWQRRYVVLSHNKLSYFKEPSTSYPQGSIDVAGIKIDIPAHTFRTSAKDPKPPPYDKFKFSIHANKTYTFAPDHLEETFQWVHALRRTSFFYSEHKQKKPEKIDGRKVKYGDVSGSAVVQGLLGKQGGAFASWKTRWCVVAQDTLFYFKSSSQPKPTDSSAGCIPLSICDVTGTKDKISRDNALCLLTNNRTYFFQAQSEQDCERWLTSLTGVIEKLREKNGTSVDFSRKRIGGVA